MSAARALRPAGRLALALAGALAVNLALVAVGPLLVREPADRPLWDAQPVSVLMPPVEEPPPPEEEPQPPEPEPPPEMDIMRLEPQAPQTPAPELERPRLDFEINPRLTGGLRVAAPGPARFELGQVDRGPLITSRVQPPYPYRARRRGIEGAVTVRFLVDRQGEVQNLTIVDSRPPGEFDRVVLETVPRWRFRPGVKDGERVETWVETTIRFRLEG